MPALLILDNEFATLWYYTDSKIVHYRIKKTIQGDLIRELFNRGGEILAQNSAKKWLCDARECGVLPKRDHNWVKGVWLRNMVAAGLRHFALVLPKEQVEAARAGDFDDANGEFVSLYWDPEEAMRWLLGR